VKRVSLISAAVLTVALLIGTGTAAAASSAIRVVEVKGPAFPVRTYVVSLPKGRKLAIRDVSVTENGDPVIEQTLVPASQASKRTFGVVLVLDTSYSMTGQPIAAAVAAAQAFAAQRNPNEELGVIEFNRDAKPVLNLTDSAASINGALSKPPAIATGTHIYDAVAQAEAMLTAGHITSGSIVVLSDGADTGSTKTLADVAKDARGANMKIYTIGLADKSYKPRTLKALATAGRGEYAQATAQALTPLFDQLSQVLSNEYLLQYKSLEGPNVPVRVDVTVKGLGKAVPEPGYRTPSNPVRNSTPAPYKPSIGSRIWGSTITMLLLALLAAGAVALLVIVLLLPKRSGLPARMAEFVSIRSLQKGHLTAEAEDDASEQETWWTRLGETLEIAEIGATPEMVVFGTIALTVLTFLLIWAGTGSFLWALFALGIPYLSREWVVRTLARRRNRFAEQLPDALQVIASALRSGHSFAGALAVVVESGSEPMKSEMQQVVADEQLGIAIQDSIAVVA
jgi:tight adherence protein B